MPDEAVARVEAALRNLLAYQQGRLEVTPDELLVSTIMLLDRALESTRDA